MNTRQTFPQGQGLADLATHAVRLGREFAQMATAAGFGGSGAENTPVNEALLRLISRDPSDPRDEAVFDDVQSMIVIALATEERGTQWRGFDTCDGYGPGGGLREYQIYSPRGEDLLQVKGTFEMFLAARASALDRAAAERAARRLVSA